eukprot:1144703-Pelagomonas_calceolata.AAC.6
MTHASSTCSEATCDHHCMKVAWHMTAAAPEQLVHAYHDTCFKHLLRRCMQFSLHENCMGCGRGVVRAVVSSMP